jgi:hypothetical protein
VAAVIAAVLLSISWLPGRSESSDAGSAAGSEINLESLSWLVGSWKANAFGGVCEEVWSPPSAGTMTGTFKLVVDGKVSFYELFIMTIENGGPTLHLKHFNADLTGWEEKDEVITFAFIEMTDNELRLDGLTYRSISADSLQIELQMKGSDGKVRTQMFNCWRVGR